MRGGWSVALVLGGMVGLCLGASDACAQAAAPPPDTKTWVKEHDKNGDGKLDREEFHQAVIEAFFFRDTNKDGYLTISELVIRTPEEVKAIQRKADGRLTLQEYLNALHRDFAAADTDEDGLLTVEEIDSYMRRAK